MSQTPDSGTHNSGPWYDLRIARIVEETRDARSVVLEIPEAIAAKFHYRAGQFLSFRVEVDGHKLVRCYSLASSPDADVEHKVTIKRIEDGRVSNWFNQVPSVGDTLHVLRPAGLFCLREDAEASKKIVLFGGGSGITPVISILKTSLATTSRAIKLVYANRDRDSIIFREELDQLAAKHPDRIELIHRLDVDHGFIDASAVRGYVGNDTGADYYICGPGPFMDTVETTLHSLGIPKDSIFIERFESPEEVAARHAEEHAADDARSPGAAESIGDSAAAGTGGDAPEKVIVTLDGNTIEVDVVPGKTVLEMARDAGLDPPFACEEGYCGCCMARLKNGSVHMKANDCLDRNEIAAGSVLTCQSMPTSKTVEVEYPD
jgi:3-ketosteroid 9alpha-monooxygenase subunit B